MSEVVKLNKSILGLTGTIEKFVESMGKYETETNKAKKAVSEITKLQKKLGVATREGDKFFNKAGLRVSAFGEELTDLGKEMGNFNKRTAIMNSTVAVFTKQKRAVPFLEGLTKYLELGGTRLEYFAEFLSSTKEELTVFGVEAAKARKFMYGFLPPGMFRMMNKLSSTMQFFGGTIRKVRDNTGGANKKLEMYKDALKDLPEDSEEFAKIQEIISNLEKDSANNIFTTMFGGIGKLKGLIDRNITEPLTEGLEKGNGAVDKLKKVFPNMFKASKNFVKVATFTPAIKGALKLRKGIKGINERFAEGEGAGKYTKMIEKANKKLEQVDDTLSTLDMDKLRQQSENFAKTEEKRNEALEKHQQRIEQLEESRKGKTNSQLKLIDSQIAQIQGYMKNLEGLAETHEQINNQIEEGTKLTEQKTKLEEKVLRLKAKEIGSKELSKNIKIQKKAIKERLKTEMQAAEAIEAKKQRIVKLQEAEAFYAAQKLDASLTPQEQIQASISEDKARQERKKQEAELPDLETDFADFQTETGEQQALLANNESMLEVLKKNRKESVKNLLNKHPFYVKAMKFREAITKTILPVLRMVLMALSKYLIIAFLAIAAIIVILRKIGPVFMKAFGKAFKWALTVKDFIMEGVGRITGGLGKMFSFIFGNGTLDDFINGGFEFLLGLTQTAIGLLGALALLAVGFVVEFGKMAFKFVKNKFLEFIKDSKKLTGFIIKIVAIVAIIVAFVMGAPILVAVAIGAIIYKFGKKFIDPISRVIGLVKDIILGIYAGIAMIIQMAINGIIKAINAIKPGKDIAEATFGDNAVDYLNKNAIGNRMGGKSDGRVTMVGEGGRELLFLPKGSRVVSNAETEKRLGNRQPITNNFNITINAKDSSQTEMRRIADMIGRDIAAKINRTTSSSTLR